ncbi:MAG: hypothetical protein DME26_14525, partial [Verrucomicrobia bacterium]
MNLLKNRLVVGLLAVAALAVVFKSALWPILSRSRTSARRSSPPALVSTAVAASRESAAESSFPRSAGRSAALSRDAATMSQTTPPSAVDSSVAQTNSPRWTGYPQRDPFQIRREGTKRPGTFQSAMETLTLNAILRQSGSTLAVINNRLVNEGDMIQGFRIENIGAERVWVFGANGREQVVFDYASSLRVNALKSGGVLDSPLVGQEARLDWPYRVVDGLTNNAETDKGWFLVGGKVLQKLGTGSYLISAEPEKDQASRVSKGQSFIVKNVPLSMVDDDPMPSIRCKYVGDESYGNRTVRVFDFG